MNRVTRQDRLYKDLQGRLYDTLARSRKARRGALWVRNVATQVLAHRLATTTYPERNGEFLLQRTLGPEIRTAVDVGANRGEWTAHLLRAAPALERVLCYEPGCAALEALRGKLGFEERVTIIDAAVAEAAGEQEFFEEPDAGETSSLVDLHYGDVARRTVRVVTLDDELDRLGVEHVDMLKIDAEGMDLHVLRGARRALCDHRIAVAQFEYHTTWATAGSTLAAAFRLLRGHGYEVLVLRADGLHLFEPERTGELFAYANFVALSSERTALLRDWIRPNAL